VFAGLAFWSLLCITRKKLGWAALLRVLAAWTRAVGVCLVIPLFWSWFTQLRSQLKAGKGINFDLIIQFLFASAPGIAFLLWKLSPIGVNSDIVQKHFFSREVFHFEYAIGQWSKAFISMFTGRPATCVYSIIEFAA